MLLENFRSQKIIWDRANKTIFEKIEANSGDSNGRKLVVQVINQGVTENLLGTTLSLGWKYRKGAKGLDAFNVVDASKGIFEIYYTTEMLSNIGNIEASLILIDSTGRIESSTFTISVTPSTVDDESVESENSFTALTEALVKVNEWNGRIDDVEQDYADRAEALEETYAPRLTEVTAQLAQTDQQIESYNYAINELFEPPLASNEWVTDSIGTKLDMSSEEFLALFYDPYVGTHQNGYTVTKNLQGKEESGVYDTYEYVFTPQNPTKTILLSSGMHPWELPASFGLAHFIRHLMTTPYMHGGFKYLKENVQIKIIPIINTWGFNQNPKTYANSKGVNINRNFDVNGRWEAYNGGTEYFNNKGVSPFSEAETVILRNWLDSNADSEFWIDCHTGRDNPHVDNWVLYNSIDTIAPKIKSAISKLENRIETKYSRVPTKIEHLDSESSIQSWYALEGLGLSNMTLELTNFWGTALNNEAEDITEYETALAAYVFEFLGVLFELNNSLEFKRSISNSIENNRNLLAEEQHKRDIEVLKNLDVVLIDRFDKTSGSTLDVTETGQKWETNGNLTIESGKLRGSTSGNILATADTGISDYVLSVDVEYQNAIRIYFRYADVSNACYISIFNNSINLDRVKNGVWGNIDSYAFSLEKMKKYNFRIITNKNMITVFLDTVKIFDTTYESVPTATKVGLRFDSDDISRFDNLVVRKFFDLTAESKETALTLSTGWTGTVNCVRNRDGIVSLSGQLTANDPTKAQVVIFPTGFHPKFGHPFVAYNSSKTVSNVGFYISSSTGELFLRNPLKDTVTTGDVLIFNTVFQS